MHTKIDKADPREWHRWYAWRPVETEDGYSVWLELIWRRLEYSTYDVWPHYNLEQPIETRDLGKNERRILRDSE